MLDLHEGVRELFDEAQRSVAQAPHGTMLYESRRHARKTTRRKPNQCNSCGRRGHLTPTCTNYEDWYEPPAWMAGSA